MLLISSNQYPVGVLESMFTGTNISTLKVAIFATKFAGKAENVFSLYIRDQLLVFGFTAESIDILDLEEAEKIKKLDLEKYQVFYVCGGNTFEILNFARQINLKTEIEKLLERGGVYIGQSAGAIIVGPNINIAGEVASDENTIGLQALEGFKIVEEIACPHYDLKQETEVLKFEEKYGVKVLRIDNGQVVRYLDGKVEML